MQIDEENGIITFDRLVSSSRSLGSMETLTITKVTPAKKAIATNAKGVFAHRELQVIYNSSKNMASSLKGILTTS